MAGAIDKATVPFCNQLLDDWKPLAVTLKIPAADQRKFNKGSECFDVLDWLKKENQLHNLVDAIGLVRSDLLTLAKEIVNQYATGSNPDFANQSATGRNPDFANNDYKSRIVAIAVPGRTSGSYCAIGTGYWISDDLILTARHVVFPDVYDESKPVRIYWGAGKEISLRQTGVLEVRRDSVVWDGSGFDAVLLRCSMPKDVQGLPSVRLAERAPQSTCSWKSLGYPAAATAEGLLVPVDFSGTYSTATATDQFLQIAVQAGPATEEWDGALGMPIFSAGGGQILGIVMTVPGNSRSAKLHVIPVWRMLADDAFHSLLYPSTVDFAAFRTEMLISISGILLECDFLCEAVAKQYKVAATDRKLRCQQTAQKIGDSDPATLLTHLYKIKYASDRIDKAVASVLLQVMHAALPILNDSAMHEAARRANTYASLQVVQLDIASQTVLEIAMARAEGKEACYITDFPSRSQDISGKYALARLPVPGRDLDGNQVLGDIIRALTPSLDSNPAAVADPFYSRLGEKFIPEEFRSNRYKTLDEQINYIRGQLRREKSNTGRSYYYAVVLPDMEPQKSSGLQILEMLRQNLPEIFFLVLNSADIQLSKEMEHYGNISELLQD